MSTSQKFFKKIVSLLLLKILLCSCVSTPTIQKPGFVSLGQGIPLTEQQLSDVRSNNPNDVVFADLLQAFALMRNGNIEDSKTRKKIQDLLMGSVSTFEDLSDPVNFSEAFSADEDKPFRGRAYERMFASTMAGVFLMAENNCERALPYFRNAEFLDARFQKMPFGTDAPLIYSLMYRCLLQSKGDQSEIARAKSGVLRSVRFLTLQEPLIELMISLSQAEIRPRALANRIAYMIYEIALYHALISVEENASLDEILNDAAKNASLFTATLESHFDDEYKERLEPLIEELAKVYGLSKSEGKQTLETFALDRVTIESQRIAKQMNLVVKKNSYFRKAIRSAQSESKNLSEKIIAAASAPRMAINFSGAGPSVVREGSYQEVSVIKTSPDGSERAKMRAKNQLMPQECGFHRSANKGFSIVFCDQNSRLSRAGSAEVMPTLEILSLSRKAKMIGGRKFEKVLKGRAQFRAATEQTAEIGAWSAFFLFHLGSQMMQDCQRRGQGDSCYTSAYAVWAVAGVTAIFSGAIWLAGRASNPSADSRFVPMYESAWLAI